MKILTLANQKGGVGKSAVTTQLAFYCAKVGLRVLVLDLDHQRNTSAPLIQSGRAAVASFAASELLMNGTQTLPGGDVVLVAGDDRLSGLERQPQLHNTFVNHLHAFLQAAAGRFDIALIDTNPNPDVRYVAALVVSDHLLSPVQLNQEALSGIGALLNHPRYGFHNIKATLNNKLDFMGILPNLVEPTPFQRDNLKQLVARYAKFLIALPESGYAHIPKRSAIAEAQASGLALFDLKKTAAREAWAEIKPSFDALLKHMNLEIHHGT